MSYKKNEFYKKSKTCDFSSAFAFRTSQFSLFCSKSISSAFYSTKNLSFASLFTQFEFLYYLSFHKSKIVRKKNCKNFL